MEKLLSHIFKSEEEPGITEEELLTIVDEAQAGGGIGEDERVLIRSAIEFDELEAVDIYTPRIDIVGIPVDMPKDEIAKIFADTGYSRLPVYEENIDQIIGILYQKDFYNFIYRSDVTIRDSVRPVILHRKIKRSMIFCGNFSRRNCTLRLRWMNTAERLESLRLKIF